MASEDSNYETLDESRISGESGEMYLFQWLSSLEKTLKGASVDTVKSKLSDAEAILVKVISAPEPFPTPGRALRNVATRCLVLLYSRGETRSLFDTLGSLLKIVGDHKTVEREAHRVAAFYSLGELMKNFGSQFMSYMVEIATTALKTLKTSNVSLLRYHALVTLCKSLSTAKKAVTDAVAKDIIRQMKNGLNDKSLPIQRAAADVLIVMYSIREEITLSDVESVVGICTKSLETVDQVTRAALSRLAGHILALTQVEIDVPLPNVAQKGKKENDRANGDDILSPASHSENTKKAMLSPSEMLTQISVHFNKPASSRKTRIGLFDFYVALLNALGPSFVESNYSDIVSHFMTEIVSIPRNSTTRYETMLVRKLVGVILRDLIGVRMLNEQAQIAAIQELSNSYLKRWPAMMPGQVAPSHLVLVIALKEVAELLQQFGNTPPPVQDAISEPLVTLLAHPSHTVRVNASWALRCFCYSTPLRLAKTLLTVIEKLQRDINSLVSPTAPSDISFRALGHAYGLSALISIIPERPLYVSYDISAKVLDMAIQLLKRAGEHDIKVAAVEVEVAWISIASLMSLGPNFVRPHLPQLLVLWRNALPKPTTKDAATGTGRSAEWLFLLHVRESALGAIFCFLHHNSSSLITLDVARRIASLLTNALSFANSFVSQSVTEPVDQPSRQETPIRTLSHHSREALLRRRVFQCFTALGFSSITETTQATLLQSAVSLFAGPDSRTSTVQAEISSSSGAFTSIWKCIDSYAYGVTYIDISDDSNEFLDGEVSGNANGRPTRDAIELFIESLLNKPVIGGREHDPLSLCLFRHEDTQKHMMEPPPSATAVVDAAIRLFAQLLPLQDITSAQRIVSLLVESVQSPKIEKMAGRKAAVSINSLVSLVLFLRQVTEHHSRQARDNLANPRFTSLLASFLKESLIDGDAVLRLASSEAVGRLSSLAGTSFLTSQIKLLVDQVVNNRDPHGRAGCAHAFGAIYSYVGGLGAGPLLKTTVNILMSLSNDPHPVVHFWALSALARVINAASLAYAPFVSSTLGMLLKVYLMESHEVEGGSFTNANTSGDLPAYPVVCQIVDAVITVLGPDIQESPRIRALVLDLVHEFSFEEDDGIAVGATKCIQHFLMFAPEHVEIPELVNRFRSHLSSSRRPLKLATINALYQLVQKDALSMSKLGGDRLVEDLFRMLDDDSSVEGVRNVISSWLQQTVIYNPSAWIDLCQGIMSRTTASHRINATTKEGVHDDEGESLSVGATQNDTNSAKMHLTSRWRTQKFALECLHSTCVIVAQSGRREHLDIPFSRSRGVSPSGLLVSRVPDLIKMAFTASTAYVTEIRLEGLVVLKDVIQVFCKSPDPEYADALLLEQHQAPITASLTPAFSSDTTPEILASAVQACAVFVGCGIIKDASRMGRILKLLTVALEQSKDTGMMSLGDTGELSPNASTMLRISTLSAWAQLEVASAQEKYLSDIVKPHRATLASLWVASLRDYASIRADSEFVQDSSTGALDPSYSSLGREVLLPYYLESWPIILQAVASFMQVGDPHISAAMDGKEVDTRIEISESITRQEPSAFFFVIFGLVYEALSSFSSDSSTTAASHQPAIIASLQTLKWLTQPSYAGKALMESATFDELISLCYRMAMTEAPIIQVHLIETMMALAKAEIHTQFTLSSSRAHCLRISAHVIRRSISTPPDPAMQGDIPERIKMITAAFEALHVLASTIEPSLQEDIRAVGVLLYSELLQDETTDADLAGPTLPSLKALLTFQPNGKADAHTKYNRLIHGILSACLLTIDEMRGRQGSISTRKIKNNMLAAVLILTVVPPSVKISRAVIEHCCFLISQKLVELSDVSLTASHCAKTLIVAAASGNRVLHQCMKRLLPSLVEYTTKVVPLVSEDTKEHLAAINEIWKAFSAFFVSVPEVNRVHALGIILPTMILLLTSSEVQTLHSQVIAQLLSFASVSPMAFKEATAKLDGTSQEVLERALRKEMKGASLNPSHQPSKPQISLRSF